MPAIELSHVTKRWGGYYGVDDLSLSIDDNAFVTLLGPSGCGKTTTLRMIAGLETPTSGKITIGDKVVFDSATGVNVPPNKRKVGFLFQNYALWPNMTVRQNIVFGLENDKTLSKAQIEERLEHVSSIVKIEPYLKRYPSELSGGQQQRVAIARTLAPRPDVLFMDEPLSNLDAKLRLEMRSELQRLHVDTGATFVYVTHDQTEAMTLATRICLLDNGLLQQYDRPLSLYRDPVNLFTADFVGSPSINFINASAAGSGSVIDLTLLEGKHLTFTPNTPLDLAAARSAIAADAQAQAAAEAERSKVKGYVKKENTESNFKYRVPTVDGNTDPAAEYVVGVRPESVRISEDGPLTGVVYSSMPTGMDTTLRIRVGNLLLTSVVFGSVDYALDEQVRFGFAGDGVLLFDAGSGKQVARGRLG
ncbi:MAG: ABC transporter ATP-binding protein [Propionibacteriaceae bacterium]|jgi:multiple sugar transport system ATP-binding protein|nr:ABC transporter ATP-binding protein [Propionibacteriaceae bacterium]